MIMTNSKTKKCVNVLTERGDLVEASPNQIHDTLLSLTSDGVVIKRAEPLILIQLAYYSTIKEHDLNCIIYRSLEQLRYKKIANHYYNLTIKTK